MEADTFTRNIWIAIGSLSGAGVILAFMRTWAWFSKSGREIIDLATIGKFFAYIMGIVGTVFFLVAAAGSVWWLVFIKKQYEPYFEDEYKKVQNQFRILLIVAFVLKTIDIIHVIARQTTIDIFFMDWERPKAGDLNHVSAWRTCFVANEFNEIQTFRRIRVSFHLLLVLLLLKVIGLENFASANPIVSLSEPERMENSTVDYDKVFRTGIAFPILVGTAFLQYIVYIIFYQRFIEDKIINFVDLCSVSNISVFILDHIRHGYYIHGRSPHGTTDVNMKDMLMNLDRESRMMSGTRGLQDNSSDQIFIMKINRSFRMQYEALFRKYYNFVGPKRRMNGRENYTDVLLESYQNLNSFLCAYIDCSLPAHHYFIRNRYFLEKIFNYEFQIGIGSGLAGYLDSLFFVDNDRTFTKILFYGEEDSLFIWNATTFLFIDYLSQDYVLAAILAYLLNLIAVGLRNSFGRRNLSKKTLVPRELLI
ncbi:unnamed protein product [Adineta ricciae]|uniref:Meckelin n=1 Tax=Adineta ricciae TaxID=249248 RepID=A0A814ERP4_ADIRI|nr:unnamed protein product [Adineta ricciae]CAF1426898.1 unnamed protein product [Adineta ricciae]